MHFGVEAVVMLLVPARNLGTGKSAVIWSDTALLMGTRSSAYKSGTQLRSTVTAAAQAREIPIRSSGIRADAAGGIHRENLQVFSWFAMP